MGNDESHVRQYEKLDYKVSVTTKRRLPKAECPDGLLDLLKCRVLNICHGNTALIVVRVWESHAQGEGGQFIHQYIKRKVREAYEKSYTCIEIFRRKGNL